MTASNLSAQDFMMLLPGIIASSELLRLLPLAKNSNQLAKLLKKILRMLRSPHISDHRKEQVILHYATKLLTQTLKITIQLGIAFIPVGLSLWIIAKTFQQMLALSLDPSILAYISACSLLYLFLRTRKKCPAIQK